jgi:hypothetical protein
MDSPDDVDAHQGNLLAVVEGMVFLAIGCGGRIGGKNCGCGLGFSKGPTSHSLEGYRSTVTNFPGCITCEHAVSDLLTNRTAGLQFRKRQAEANEEWK